MLQFTQHLNIEELESQYNDLEETKDKPTSYTAIKQTYPTASAPANHNKNRYSNILPNEGSRVKLNQTWRTRTNNYINASYCGDAEKETNEHEWIATQCPLPSTFNDFWQMVWEQRSGVIVTLLKLFENGYKKGDMYWPNRLGMTCVWGDIQITLLSQSVSKEVITRNFTLTHSVTDETRQVIQLQFMGWPDFGTPSDAHSIVSLYNLTKLYREAAKLNKLNGPVITHCSAGVGRAGTFISSAIAISKLAKYTRSEEDKTTTKEETVDLSKPTKELPSCFVNSINRVVNVPDIIKKLREQRSWAMVQTVGQFIFIYKVLVAALIEQWQSKASSPLICRKAKRKTTKRNRRHQPYQRRV